MVADAEKDSSVMGDEVAEIEYLGVKEEEVRNYENLKQEVARNNAMLEALQAQLSQQNEVSKIKAEHGDLKEGLLLAQKNIALLEVAIDEGIKENKRMMECNQVENEKMLECINDRLEKAFGTLNKAVGEIDQSNDALMNIMEVEVRKLGDIFREENRNVVMILGVEAVKTLEETFTGFSDRLNGITKQHQTIVDTVRKLYECFGYARIGLWIWRFAVLMGIVAVLRYGVKVDSLWDIFKMLTGLHFIFG